MSREELCSRIADVALLRGNFVLRSGRTSSFYLDKYRFSTRPELLGEIAEAFAHRLQGIKAQRLAGAELGGIPLVTATSLKTGLPSIFVRNEKKGYGTANRIEGEVNPGDRVALLEDIATTGGQAVEAARALEQAGAEVVRVIAVIDRQEGARENLASAGFSFEALFTRDELGIDG